MFPGDRNRRVWETPLTKLAKAGRQPTPEADALKVGSIRLTQAQWDKLARLGGVAWLGERIDKARTPEEP